MIQNQHIYVRCLKVLKTAGPAARFVAPNGQSHHWQGQKCFLAEINFFETYIKIKSISVENNGQSDIVAFFLRFLFTLTN